ncbi:MAG: 4-hydroxy-tetrahydrodipicolinate reductase [Alphaproteobacteria bacterium]|nr:4-hydroxy-tetrahydrodipicolinate reductase [Alphaproteobacteria bacterium]
MTSPLGQTTPKIAVHGATGRLGRLIVHEAGERYTGPVERDGFLPPCDVVIDVSSADGLAALLPRLSGQALLVGTTGDLPADALAAYAERAPVAVVPNFSVGVPMLVEILERVVPQLPPGWSIEVVEAHHQHKQDAPSGTAKRLIRATGRDDVPWHSIRAGDTVGEHTVWLAGPGERLELKHVATRREVFAIGAIRHAVWLATQAPGLYRP